MAELTNRQAYLVAYEFLKQFYERVPSDDVAVLLGSMTLLEDGGSADPAMLRDWQKCAELVLRQSRQEAAE